MKTFIFNLFTAVLFLGLLINFSPALAKLTKFKPKTNISDTKLLAVLNKYKINTDHVSLQILENSNEVFSLNAATKKVPASVSKLFTTFGIVKKLPAGHKFYTRLYSDGKNLYLVGGGDPSFVSENLWYLVNEFTRSGIKSVKSIIVDDSLFDKIRYDGSRQDTRVDRAYDAPVGAMSFNWNSVNIYVRPAKIEGEKATVVIDPESGFFDLVNNTKTVAPTKKELNELSVQISSAQKMITVSGDILLGENEKVIYKNVAEPDLWAGKNLAYFLKQRGIRVEGSIETGQLPEKADLLATYESKSLSYILADMNKFSNNFVAEMLVKNLAAQEQKSGASLRRGVDIIREELVKVGLSREEVVFSNPSGLTRDNLFSAASLNTVLAEAKKDFSVYPTFLNGLPIAGIDGTMKKRMKNTLAEGWVRAKTGYLDGVVSLAGYAGRRDGRVLTFTFLYNGPRDESIVREAFDQLLLSSLK